MTLEYRIYKKILKRDLLNFIDNLFPAKHYNIKIISITSKVIITTEIYYNTIEKSLRKSQQTYFQNKESSKRVKCYHKLKEYHGKINGGE